MASIVELMGNGKCMKINNTLVMGNYLGKGKCPGLDYLQPSLTNLEMFIKKEYPKYDILIETFLSRYLKINFLHKLINQYKIKIFHLQTDMTELDKRAIKRNMSWDKNRTDYGKFKVKQEVYDILSDDIIKPHVIPLINNTTEDLSNNVKFIEKFIP